MTTTTTTNESTNKSQIITFSSGLTSEVLVLSLTNMAIGAFVAWTGWNANQMWPGRHRGDVFFYLGLALALLSALAPLRRLRQNVRLSENAFHYKNGSVSIRVPWATMTVFQPTPPGRKWFRRLLVGDDNANVTLDSQSFNDYDSIVKLVGEIRKRNRPFD